MEETYIIRRMNLDDLQGISRIEQSSFTVPWSYESFHNELTQNHFAYYLVLEINGVLAGYGGMWIIVDEAHITNIAISPEYRGQRWGEKLLAAMQLHAYRQGAKAMTLEVRVSNTIAQRLYHKFGFKKTGIRPNYYSDNGEDALIMWVNFEDEANEQMGTNCS
ncbi:ribosomal protein S18-alanine N-acetyltransferase [Ammoniphilus resinae]|uniref:Ribosomal-protein-alanine N-acetyltransferase n=1 Tax=Ammoniphilus resinae TaxID=861532 RepID=A0ABS4GIG7_9BACL|nr:ribosomal protein S18-alanine N-acetyltransferase [Ammoniphilus resinae]MBP1930043.1 ribosomal-protein-alanine N-acetyltransferase [Ammoniphilus resinae]